METYPFEQDPLGRRIIGEERHVEFVKGLALNAPGNGRWSSPGYVVVWLATEGDTPEAGILGLQGRCLAVDEEGRSQDADA